MAHILGMVQVIFVYDLTSGEFTYLNPAFEEVFKHKRDKAKPLELIEMVHKEDIDYVTEVYHDLLAGETKKGWNSASSYPVKTKGGYG